MAKAKKTILTDTFEQLAELGKSTAKNTVKQTAQTFTPLKTTEQTSGNGNMSAEVKKVAEKNTGDNHTKLDTGKLEKKYQMQDEQKMTMMRNRLFQLSKQEERDLLQTKKRIDEEKKLQEEKEEQEKKENEEQEKRRKQEDGVPRGKQRRSIFSPKKKAAEQHPETRPSVGKQ